MGNVFSRYLRRFWDAFITTFVSCSQSLTRSRLNIIGGDVLLLEVGFNFSRKRAWQYLAICQVRFWISGCGLDIDRMNGLATVNYGSFNFEFRTEVQEHFRAEILGFCAEIPGLPCGDSWDSAQKHFICFCLHIFWFFMRSPIVKFTWRFLKFRVEAFWIPHGSILNPMWKHLEFHT